LLKFFKGLRFLENVHYGVEVEVVSRQTKIFIGIVLGSHNACSCEKDYERIYGSYCFHGAQFFSLLFSYIKTKAMPSYIVGVILNAESAADEACVNNEIDFNSLIRYLG